MTPAALMLNPVGALARMNVHDGLAQVDATVRLAVPPTVVVCAAGVVIVGAATTVQVKLALPAVELSTSVTVTMTLA